MSWIVFFVEWYWVESGVGYHRWVELWVEPSVLLSAFVNRDFNPFWKLIINELNWIESTWILVNPSESWIMKEVNVHITAFYHRLFTINWVVVFVWLHDFPKIAVGLLASILTWKPHKSGENSYNKAHVSISYITNQGSLLLRLCSKPLPVI